MKSSLTGASAFFAFSAAVLWATAAAAAEECPLSMSVSSVMERTVPAGASLPQIIVKYREGVEAMSADALGEAIPGVLELREAAESGPTLPGVTVLELETPIGMDSVRAEAEVESVLDKLRQMPNVEYAHPNYIVGPHATVPDDPCFALQWHYWPHGTGAMQSNGGIDLPTLWDTNKGSADVVVAVIDTGLVATHPDLNTANVVPGWDFIDNDPDATDIGPNNGFHGTHVAGTIGVLTTNNSGGASSVNWDVKIQPIRALDENGSGSFVGIANAIFWAAGGTLNNVDVNSTPAKVINMSLGGRIECLPQNAGLIIDAITFATQQGALVVVSAGNDNANASGSTPASCPDTMTVAATDFVGQRSRFSNFGDSVDIAAPGGATTDQFGNIIDLNGDGFPDGVLSSVDGGYDLYQGTSMAAPHVSGIAALIYAKDPAANPQSVTDLIIKTATQLNCDFPCGAGLLNASAAQ